MTMKRRIVSLVTTCMFAAIVSMAAAQPPGPGGRRGAPAGGGRGGMTLGFRAGEVPLGPIVTGAPYSGEGVTTVTQTLADGTRIERTVRARLYRDSEGRTRREQTILGLGALGESQSITIVDPVARVVYALNPAKREAYRSVMPQGGERGRRVGPPPPPPPPPGGGDVGALAPPPPPPPPPPGFAGRGGPPPAGGANVAEPIGTRSIAGLAANG